MSSTVAPPCLHNRALTVLFHLFHPSTVVVILEYSAPRLPVGDLFFCCGEDPYSLRELAVCLGSISEVALALGHRK